MDGGKKPNQKESGNFAVPLAPPKRTRAPPNKAILPLRLCGLCMPMLGFANRQLLLQHLKNIHNLQAILPPTTQTLPSFQDQFHLFATKKIVEEKQSVLLPIEKPPAVGFVPSQRIADYLQESPTIDEVAPNVTLIQCPVCSRSYEHSHYYATHRMVHASECDLKPPN